MRVNEDDLIRAMKSQRLSPVYTEDSDESPGKEQLVFTSQGDRAQIELIQLMVHEDDSTQSYVKENVSLEYFTTPLLKKIAGYILDEKLSVETAAIIEYFQDKNERDSVTQILFADTQNIPPEQIVSDCLKILKSIPLKEKIHSLRTLIREKESKGEDPQKELNEVVKLHQELNEIKFNQLSVNLSINQENIVASGNATYKDKKVDLKNVNVTEGKADLLESFLLSLF